jgi:hypothetical protein
MLASDRRRYKSRPLASGNQSYRKISIGFQFATHPRMTSPSSTKRLTFPLPKTTVNDCAVRTQIARTASPISRRCILPHVRRDRDRETGTDRAYRTTVRFHRRATRSRPRRRCHPPRERSARHAKSPFRQSYRRPPKPGHQSHRQGSPEGYPDVRQASRAGPGTRANLRKRPEAASSPARPSRWRAAPPRRMPCARPVAGHPQAVGARHFFLVPRPRAPPGAVWPNVLFVKPTTSHTCTYHSVQ